MAKIKIISNPYKIKENSRLKGMEDKNEIEVSFQKWNEENQCWIDIDKVNNPKSHLIDSRFTHGFFPFNVKEIVDNILNEYGNSEIVFEGTEDEFRDLTELCREEKYANKITVSQSEYKLSNARDILPHINRIFENELHSIISQYETKEVRDNYKNYLEVYKDIIPVCVLGNYSSGKSSFINALIGNEILPSGAEPVTAKVFKIRPSRIPDSGSISLKYGSQEIKIDFKGSTFAFENNLIENELTGLLKSEYSKVEKPSVSLLINKSLELINSFELDRENRMISDTIEIEVPFIKGLWKELSSKIVILDTPGSNSASNRSHAEILEEALKGFSNGLPIYLSEFDKLDSTDNENLVNEIKKIDELDERFTMVIVNKADVADLDKGGFDPEKEKQIRTQSIPRHLYKSGIYFVSSIMGLGSKTDGKFYDDHYAELFEGQYTKFTDENSHFYKQLYKYNIMSEQLKKEMVYESENNNDRLWSNSGMFTVENQIQTFATKYSAYNKCYQAKKYLDNMIELTEKDIAERKRQREDKKSRMEQKLNNDRKEMIERIEKTSSEMDEQYKSSYDSFLSEEYDKVNQPYETKELNKIRAYFKEQWENDLNLVELKEKRMESLQHIANTFIENVRDINFDAIGDNINKAINDITSVNQTGKLIDKNTETDFLENIKIRYQNRIESAEKKIIRKSKEYWTQKTERFRETMIQVVSGLDNMEPEKRNELEKIIIDYEKLDFNFDFEKELSNLNCKFQVEFIHRIIREYFSMNKIKKELNEKQTGHLEEMKNRIQSSHCQSFCHWEKRLVENLIDEILEYNPELKKQNQEIFEETEKIKELQNKEVQLKMCNKKITEIMGWKKDN